ncbi:hypothetical protein R3P38DRAFT_2948527 [Favolaschia claudopus]|uniref:Uncharacterized protein n=1 Tax=Favolaschia claudopus TaxID=2862362 RepID=A0AAW0BIM0_9AGAR
MPAARRRTEGFEDCPNDEKRLICRICSDAPVSRGVVSFLRTSKASHLRSEKHQKAVADVAAEASMLQIPDSLRFKPAKLSFIDSLHLAESSQARVPRSVQIDPFQDVVQFDDGFFTPDGSPMVFSAGVDPENSRHTNEVKIWEQINRVALLQDHSIFGEVGDGDPDSVDGAFSAALSRMGIQDESDEEDNNFDFAGECAEREEADWFPHGSRTMFMLDLLDNLPRLRLSDDHLKAIIWVMRECKTPGVPTFSALRKKQAVMTREVDVETRHHTSSLGNHFYMNHPSKLLALDWANPLVRPFIHIYPEVSGPVEEFWQAAKWTAEIDLDQLSPMWADWDDVSRRHKHFYIKELAQEANGSYVLPMRWVTVAGVVHADVHNVKFVRREAENAIFDIDTTTHRRIPAKLLQSNYLELDKSFAIKFTSYSPSYQMPNPLRQKARGRPMFRLRIMPWSDDVSGNVSKQYNAHTNMYVTNLNLPHKKLAQEYFVRFSSTSPHASSSEQFVALGDDFIPGVWHDAYDCQLEQEILFEVMPHVLPADNPQQSENSSHIGMAGNFGCRHDLVGGTTEQRERDEGYHALYSPGIPRDREGTIQTIRWQFWAACGGNKKDLDASYSQSGVKDKIAQFWIQKLMDIGRERRNTELTDPKTRDSRLNNPAVKGDAKASIRLEIIRRIQQELWDWVITQPPESYSLLDRTDPARLDLRPGVHYNILLNTQGVDPHRDTTTEILHTFLLGNDKYVWHDTTKQWDDKKENIFAARLAAASIAGLSIPVPRPRYLVQYKNSLIGKHFKMLQQLGIFYMHDLCTPLLFELWKATGELGALLWFPQIKNMEQYMADIKTLIANLLDIWGQIDPRRILVKGKLHILAHLVDEIPRFGPAILYATEIFECWNAVFRLCSVFSNHLAPSRDIAVTLADMERFKHVVSGGWWKNADGKLVQGGHRVRTFLTSNAELQRRLGWASEAAAETGTVKLHSVAKQAPGSWSSTMNGLSLLEPGMQDSTVWVRCKHVVAQSGDICKDGGWVFFKKTEDSDPSAGRIEKILTRNDKQTAAARNNSAVVVVKVFTIADIRDSRLNMPILVPSIDENERHCLVQPKEIMFQFNAQHDCVTCGCSTVSVPLLQERIVTERMELQIKHSEQEHFILNMHALHNAHLIREVLPRNLSAPIPYLSDRVATHSRLAAQLRETGPAKRAETRAKTQATRARNKQDKAAQILAQARRQEQERDHSGSEDERGENEFEDPIR